MPAPKTKSSAVPANGSAKGKAPSTSGTATPISVADKDTSEQFAAFAGGKPDKKVYDIEQARIKTEIDALQLKLVSRFPHILPSKLNLLGVDVSRPFVTKSRSQQNLALAMTDEISSALNLTVSVTSNRRTRIPGES